MNHFTVDYSSSPAETPPRRNKLFINEPNIASTTPLVPPPSTVFGSSRFGSGKTTQLFPRQSPSTASKSWRHTPPTHRTSRSTRQPQFQSSAVSLQYSEYEEDDYEDTDRQSVPVQSLMKFSTNSNRQSRQRSFRRSTTLHSALPNKGQPNVVPGLAREFGSRAKPASVEDDDSLLLDTELFLQQMHGEKEQSVDEDTTRDQLDLRVRDVLNLWRGHSGLSNHLMTDIGPPASASSFDKAYYLATMILPLHHPGNVPIPRLLLDWLNTYHLSYDGVLRTVASTMPNPTAHDSFWDVILALVLRGRLQDAMRLLADSDFQYAATALDDGEEEPGFHGAQLQTIQSVIFKARQVINSCPAAKNDWNTTSEDWNIYRSNVEAELENLSHLASVEEEDDDDFEAENFGVKKPKRNLLRKSQRSRNLPWSIYQGLRVLYSILLGGAEEIIAQSQDWLEASCVLTIWWDGASDSSVQRWQLNVGQADYNPSIAYIGRLRDAFLCVTDPDGKNTFPINSLSPVEVAMSCVLQGQVTPFLSVTRVLSQCVAAGIAEIASTAGWIGQGSNAGLDLDDLMVLSYGGNQQGVTKDEILVSYAAAVFEIPTLASSSDGDVVEVEGWEVSLSILSRLDDSSLTEDSVHELLERFDVGDQNRTEKIINLCTQLQFNNEAREMSDKLGDYLSHNTSQYGLALLCYAKSHNRTRIAQLTEMLISYCLVQSRAYPVEEDLDSPLRSLVETPKSAFADIIDSDPAAAYLLQFYVVGYACVRRLFVLRDENVASNNKHTRPNLRARKRVAAKALIAAINSAADAIYGGLYDPDREAAISVDALLPLLGEATAFLPDPNRPSTDGGRSFTNEQLYALLAAIEDLETVVSPKVREATEACLAASVEEAKGNEPPSPRQMMLKKGQSSGTGSNFSFSLMGSEMLGGSGVSGGGKSEGSAVVIGGGRRSGGRGAGEQHVRRGWDWRDAFQEVPVERVGEEVLRRLRRGIAGELAMGELES